jgi:hypothetical protein
MRAFFLLTLCTFRVHEQIKDQGFSYLLATLRKKVSIKLFLPGFPRIVVVRFEAKHKLNLMLNLDMELGLNSQLSSSLGST